MVSDTSNDNTGLAQGLDGPDAHGQAALLLTESLIHGLIARGVITVADAVEIVDIAVEVRTDIVADHGDSPANLKTSLAILCGISASLGQDMSSD